MRPESHRVSRARDHDAKVAQGILDLRSRVALRPEEAAAALGVSARTVRSWMQDEGLPYKKVGNGVVLIPCHALETWLDDGIAEERRANALAEEVLSDL